jgi:hypothetical protein
MVRWNAGIEHKDSATNVTSRPAKKWKFSRTATNSCRSRAEAAYYSPKFAKRWPSLWLTPDQSI